MTRLPLILTLAWLMTLVPATPAATPTNVMDLPSWTLPTGMVETPFLMDSGQAKYKIWGGGQGARFFFEEWLPAVFERTLVLEELDGKGQFQWLFSGERGGVTISVSNQQVKVQQRYYDSYAFDLMKEGKAPRHPEWTAPERVVDFKGKLQSICVTMDYKMGLSVSLNGQSAVAQNCYLDLSRHQLRWLNSKLAAKGRLLKPPTTEVVVKIITDKKYQTMIGFGGIGTPPAYAQLSEVGRKLWWKYVQEYNLLIQREYPNGQRLNPAMDNWDKPEDTTPHYYADNFPNGEISDFTYNKTIRQLGGQVWFEFWSLPPWVGKDVDKYAQAMVRYCQVSQAKTGHPPEIVGIQNEVHQDTATWQKMTLTLRKQLDEAGFKTVRIHMSDDGVLKGGVKRLEAFKQDPEVWRKVDYCASHMYDYQGYFTNPDGFDPLMRQWKTLADDKPFLSTELCINDSRYQMDGYRVALAMAQLYHKNLTLTDAAAICYCWTLLNVEQPSYGSTRSLFVPDMRNGGVPIPSSHQLRTFGAYSRRVHQGMVRVETMCEYKDLLVVAFTDGGKRSTLVALNRSTQPVKLRPEWPGVSFSEMEIADPYQGNQVSEFKPQSPVEVLPGAIVTLTSVKLLSGNP